MSGPQLLLPFRGIPRARRISKNADDEEKTSQAIKPAAAARDDQQSRVDSRPSSQYIETVMRHTEQIFTDETQRQISNLELRRQMTFQAPVPQIFSTVDYKYEMVRLLSENNTKSLVPLYVRVRNMASKVEYIAKMQQRKRSKNVEWLDFCKERQFLAAISRKQSRDSLLSRLRDVGYDDDFRYLIIEDTGRDLMSLFQQYKRFEAPTVFLITYFSFQAIKELHSFEYLHLDLRPTSFWIQAPFRLKITDFYRVTAIKSKPRVSSTFHTDRFSPRRFHTKHGVLDEMDDFEAWLYVMMFITCDMQLPWKADKDEMLASKEKFFKEQEHGEGTYRWNGTSDVLMLIPHLMKEEKTVAKFMDAVNELFSIEVMAIDELETTEWGNTMVVETPKAIAKSSSKYGSCEETASLTPRQKQEKLRKEKKKSKEENKRSPPARKKK